jgi:hypothetical protein
MFGIAAERQWMGAISCLAGWRSCARTKNSLLGPVETAQSTCRRLEISAVALMMSYASMLGERKSLEWCPCGEIRIREISRRATLGNSRYVAISD